MRFLLVFVTVIFLYRAEVGEPCNGFAGIQCRFDLVCVPIQSPHPIDGAGICVRLGVVNAC